MAYGIENKYLYSSPFFPMNRGLVENTIGSEIRLLFHLLFQHLAASWFCILTFVDVSYSASFVSCSSWLFLGPINWITCLQIYCCFMGVRLYHYVAYSVSHSEKRVERNFTSLLHPLVIIQVWFVPVVIKYGDFSILFIFIFTKIPQWS